MHVPTSLYTFLLFVTPIISCASPQFFSSATLLTSNPNSDPDINVNSQLPKRDVTTILTNVSSISTIISTLTTTATIFSGSLTETLSLASTVGELKTALAKTTAGVVAEEEFDEEESKKVVGAVGELTSGISRLLEAMGVKALVIAEAGYTTLVANELKTLSASTHELFGVLEAKIMTGDIDKMKASQGTVVEAFRKAVAAFVVPVARREIFTHIGFGIH
ncbi:hydrophobic surface binding protein A-domain-containing protein [Rhexocercosporidium sp. MPI-PUGE-AT-0058]|nr:hydrophobic surface binding protein A-domain-containing protein [Rhexocercosporidium sp. MPI-PUGE-AT-0058]